MSRYSFRQDWRLLLVVAALAVSLPAASQEPATAKPEVLDSKVLFEKLSNFGHCPLYSISFDDAKPAGTAETTKQIEEIGKLLSENSNLKIRIGVHTDNDGNAKTLLDLTKRRAAALRDVLIKAQKINTAQFTIEGYGDTKPQADNGSDEGRARNRRIELIKIF